MKQLLIVSGLAILVAGCYNDKYDKLYPAQTSGDPCDTANATISYAANVSPIMAASCATPGCHDAASQQAGYNLSSYQGVKTAATTNNKLLGTIQHLPGHSPMPQGGAKLPDCQIAQITKWVNQGSPQN